MTEGPNILTSMFPDVECPKNITVSEFFYQTDRDPEAIFTVCITTGTSYTRGQVITHAKQFGRSIRSNGVGVSLCSGDIVAIYLPSIAEYFSIVLGLLENGIIAAFFNPEYTAHEINSFLDDVPVKAFVCMPEAVFTLAPFVETRGVKTLLTVGTNPTIEFQYANYFDLITPAGLDDESAENPPALRNFQSMRETAVILMSSGTSGKPKAVELTHQNIIETTMISAHSIDITFGHEIVFTQSPLFTAGGLYFRLTVPFYAHAKVISLVKFSSDMFAIGMKKYKPTFMFAVPAFLSVIASKSSLETRDFSSIRTILYGGTVAGAGLLNFLRQRLGPHVFLQAEYGMTEHGLVTFVPKHLRQKAEATGSVGVPLPGTKLKVVDVETGLILGPDQQGELCFKGPQQMKGYYRNQEATSKTIDEDGWLHSGDLGYYSSAHGMLYVSGRIKDMIKVNGHQEGSFNTEFDFQVSPEEIEDLIRRIDGVVHCSVFGIPDEKHGEVPRACVIRSSELLTEQHIHDYLQDKLVSYKKLKGGIIFVQELPLSPFGKVLRRQLQLLYP